MCKWNIARLSDNAYESDSIVDSDWSKLIVPSTTPVGYILYKIFYGHDWW